MRLYICVVGGGGSGVSMRKDPFVSAPLLVISYIAGIIFGSTVKVVFGGRSVGKEVVFKGFMTGAAGHSRGGGCCCSGYTAGTGEATVGYHVGGSNGRRGSGGRGCSGGEGGCSGRGCHGQYVQR